MHSDITSIDIKEDQKLRRTIVKFTKSLKKNKLF